MKSAADIVRKIFSDTSVAGGHRAMAKAVIPKKDFKKLYHINTLQESEDKIIELFLETMSVRDD